MVGKIWWWLESWEKPLDSLNVIQPKIWSCRKKKSLVKDITQLRERVKRLIQNKLNGGTRNIWYSLKWQRGKGMGNTYPFNSVLEPFSKVTFGKLSEVENLGNKNLELEMWSMAPELRTQELRKGNCERQAKEMCLNTLGETTQRRSNGLHIYFFFDTTRLHILFFLQWLHIYLITYNLGLGPNSTRLVR
jgi:hypothetical protein